MPSLRARVPGLTERQAVHWRLRGYVRPRERDPGCGSGFPLDWDETEAAVAAVMLRLIAAGFTVTAAAPLARMHCESGKAAGEYDLGGGIALTLTARE